ncbi:hypothetical protein LTR75_018337, partial [Friedmanniomyces endolithicus]
GLRGDSGLPQFQQILGRVRATWRHSILRGTHGATAVEEGWRPPRQATDEETARPGVCRRADCGRGVEMVPRRRWQTGRAHRG